MEESDAGLKSAVSASTRAPSTSFLRLEKTTLSRPLGVLALQRQEGPAQMLVPRSGKLQGTVSCRMRHDVRQRENLGVVSMLVHGVASAGQITRQHTTSLEKIASPGGLKVCL